MAIPLSLMRKEHMALAVAEVRKDFPSVVLVQFGGSGTPADPMLFRLGSDFHDEVYMGRRNRALKIYDKIQRRVRQLLREAA